MISEFDKAFVAAWFDERFGDRLLHAPAKAESDAPEDEGIPPAMLVGNRDESGWGAWRPIPSTLTEQDIIALEQTLPAPFPPLYRAYLTSRFVLSYALRGKDWQIQMPGLPSDFPLGAVEASLRNWEPLVSSGYIPFADYGQGAGPVCFDLMQGDGEAAVIRMDHEEIFHLADREAVLNRQVLAPLARPLFGSFREFLNGLEVTGTKPKCRVSCHYEQVGIAF